MKATWSGWFGSALLSLGAIACCRVLPGVQCERELRTTNPSQGIDGGTIAPERTIGGTTGGTGTTPDVGTLTGVVKAPDGDPTETTSGSTAADDASVGPDNECDARTACGDSGISAEPGKSSSFDSTSGVAGTSAGSSTSEDASPLGYCGDGYQQERESCDDDNTASGDGCDENCDLEVGWSCSKIPCGPICGDGVLVGHETNAGGCDDHNRDPNDGCDEDCRVETGFSCRAQPSSCETGCGDGQTSLAEECDDGNDEAGDGCFACKFEPGATCDSVLASGRVCVTNRTTSSVYSMSICGQAIDELEACPGDCVEGACRCVVRVKPDGNDDGSGESWFSAKQTITAALAAAEGRECEVWVAEGTYHPTTTGTRGDTFLLRPGISLYGGFLGTEAARVERPSSPWSTRLDGGSDGTLDSGVYHVVTGANNTLLDGFTITGGNAGDDCGGGMLNSSEAVSLRNVNFEFNYTSERGAGLCNLGGTITIESSSFRDNASLGRSAIGLALFHQEADTYVRDALFIANNHSHSPGHNARGAAIAQFGGLVTLEESTIQDNDAPGPAVDVSANSELTVRGVFFIDNPAIDGPAGAGLSVNGRATIVDSVFSNNRTSYAAAGALNVGDTGTAYIASTRFVFNDAGEGGGALANSGVTTVVGSVFHQNATRGLNPTSTGGAILNEGVLHTASCTFIGNRSEKSGGAIWFGPTASGSITNSIFWDNYVSATTEAYSDIHVAEGAVLTLGNNTFSASTSCPPGWDCPVVDPGITWVDELPLPTALACIDSGDNTLLPPDEADLDLDGDLVEPLPLDLRGAPRVSNGIVDLGAVEVQP